MKAINIYEYKHYFIDEFGNVFNSSLKKLKSAKNKNNGYIQIILQNGVQGLKPKNFYIHRLVALTYIENINNYPQINHIDFNKSNNHISNLEWCTGKQNIQHKIFNQEFERLKFDNINSNRKLVEKGVNHYRIYKNISYVNELWDCSSTISYEILRLNTVRTNSRYYLSDIIRYQIADEMKSVGLVRFPHGWKDKLKSKYHKKYGIILTPSIIAKIKSDIYKKIL
jgi:hypothetical protein